jgi:hypothetical protein
MQKSCKNGPIFAKFHEIFAKISKIFRKQFCKTGNADFRENFCKNLVSVLQKRKQIIFEKIFAKILSIFRKNEKLRFSLKISQKIYNFLEI